MRSAARALAYVAGTAGVAVAVGATMTPAACTTHQCDSSCAVIGGPPRPNCVDGGAPEDPRMDGADLVWESSPPGGPWLDFGSMRTLFVTYPRAFASTPILAECDIAADSGDPQGNFVLCGGNLAQFIQSTPSGMQVFNPNCAGYGLRLVMRGPPGIADAGDDGGGAPPQDSPSE